MADARVALCRLRAPPEGGASALSRAEDALRLAPFEGGRLLLLRRLDLGRAGRGPAAARALETRAADLLRAAGGRAVHGGAPHAAAAEAVWFEGEAEARRLLLLRRLRGMPCDAWFWRLLAPAPRGREAAALIAAATEEAARSARGQAALAVLLRAAAEAGLAEPFLRLAAEAAERIAWTPPSLSSHPRASASAEAIAAARGAAAEALDAAPASLRHALAEALTRAGAPHLVPLLVRRTAALALAQGLAAAPLALERAAEMVDERPPDPAPASSRAEAPPRTSLRRPGSLEAPDRRPTPPRTSPLDRGARTRRHDAAGPAPPRPGAPSRDAPASPDFPLEIRTDFAGLLLALGPLRRLGFTPWLADRPDLAAAGFGAALLDDLARLCGADEDDPIRLVLVPAEPRPPAPLPELRAWRRGLDGWLRRRPRLGLAELVRRPGWIVAGEDRLDLRWPLDAADLRLRRLALDADPGWTPWLGREVRFHYDDAPLR